MKRPEEFFRLAIESISVSDPYVPERMFAAAYGAALSSWSDSYAAEMRKALGLAAREIYKNMFAPSAPHPTWHALYQQYCLGIIALAKLVEPDCLTEDEAEYIAPPFKHLPNPYDDLPQYDSNVIERTLRASIEMDFGNYTVGKLVPHRRNYDGKNSDYQLVLRAIVSRMLVLGYDPEQFETVDAQMPSFSRMGDDKRKVERYGKKYSWIAYFEMWRSRYIRGQLGEGSSSRPSDADIDPTFPLDAENFDLALPDLFGGQSTEFVEWVACGPVPDYSDVLLRTETEGPPVSWILLDGFVEQSASLDHRQIFTFIRGLLVDSGDVDQLRAVFANLTYPGNSAIPEIPAFYYTYAGEMPFNLVPNLDADLEQFRDSEPMFKTDRWSEVGISVEIPVQNYNWENYHSVVNETKGACLPSKSLCEALGLTYRANSFDLYDASGIASLYREGGEYSSHANARLCYLRRDLLDDYLARYSKVLVWLVWGERGIHYNAAETDGLYECYVNNQHIHKRFEVYEPVANHLPSIT